MKTSRITAALCALAAAAGTAGAFPNFGNAAVINTSITASAANTIKNGNLSDDLKWIFDSDGTLTISRTSAAGSTAMMPDFETKDDIPWLSYRDQIKKVVINKGITYIGKGAFIYYPSLTVVQLPEDLQIIGMYSFFGCT